MNTTANPAILVGVDGSDPSLDALRYAAKVSAAFGAPLRAITTWDYPTLGDVYTSVGWSPEKDAAAILESSIDTVFAGDAPSDLTTAVLAGPAPSVLIKESRGAEMLVLGSRGRGGFAGLLLGSVSSTCSTHAHCPVLIVRQEKHDKA